MEKQIAGTERELQKVQFEEDRAIRLYVSEKITEEQLDRQRKFITERLETLREKLSGLPRQGDRLNREAGAGGARGGMGQ